MTTSNIEKTQIPERLHPTSHIHAMYTRYKKTGVFFHLGPSTHVCVVTFVAGSDLRYKLAKITHSLAALGVYDHEKGHLHWNGGGEGVLRALQSPSWSDFHCLACSCLEGAARKERDQGGGGRAACKKGRKPPPQLDLCGAQTP